MLFPSTETKKLSPFATFSHSKANPKDPRSRPSAQSWGRLGSFQMRLWLRTWMGAARPTVPLSSISDYRYACRERLCPSYVTQALVEFSPTPGQAGADWV